METKQKITALQLVESALMIAVATVCSIVKIDLPFGGGITIVSMLPLILISHRYGWKWGVLTAFTYSLIQMILGLDNVGYATSFLMGAGIVLLDYVIAYTVIGLSGIFGKDRKAVTLGILVTFTLRFCCHLISGAWIWGSRLPEASTVSMSSRAPSISTRMAFSARSGLRAITASSTARSSAEMASSEE